MKRILTILAAIAVVACSKTEVNYDSTVNGEILVAPVASTITKAAITNGVYPEENHLSLFSYHSPSVSVGTVSDYTKFSETYLYDTEYHYTGVDNSTRIWAGLNSSYYWPITGSLVFAGYSLQTPATGEKASPKIGKSVSYVLTDDQMKINGYVQSENTGKTFDLLYFGRTATSYNNRRDGAPIGLDFKHALSWITIKVKGGNGALIDGHKWSVTNVKLAGVQTTGDFTYTGTAATKVAWVTPSAESTVPANPSDVVIYTGTKELTSTMTVIETVTDGTVVIPQGAKTLWVTIAYTSPAGDDITEVIDIPLSSYTANWVAGNRYTYELTFAPQEIKVAPVVETWPDPGSTTTWPTNN